MTESKNGKRLTPVRLNYHDDNFKHKLDELLAWESVSDDDVQTTVKSIIADVRQRGDAALVDYSCRFDRLSVSDMKALTLHHDDQLAGRFVSHS